MQQLQVEWPIAVLAVQERQDATKHRVARSFGRQGDVEAAMAEPPLQFQMGIERRLGLALAHRGFDQQDCRLVDGTEGIDHGLLQRTRREAEHFGEGFGRNCQRRTRHPADRVERRFRVARASRCEPAGQIVAILGCAERKIQLVRTDPIGEARQPGEQHEIRSSERDFRGRLGWR